MPHETGRRVLEVEARAILNLIPRLGESFDRAVAALTACRGRVVTTGMGKSGIVCKKIAATLASTGTPALFLHPAEATHGDLGMLMSGDVVLALSNSGETGELIGLLPTIKRLGVPLISFVGHTGSTLAKNSDVVLDVSVDQEACRFGLAPTASTTAALALGDALAVAVSEKKGFRLEDFARLHPGGRLGKKLTFVKDLMHAGAQVPRVTMEASMQEVIYEMSRKGLGITSVTDLNGGLVGVISDGDLRRLLERDRETVLSKKAGECMTKDPVTISESELATSALNLLEQRKITSLMVTDEGGGLVGVIHLHDLWGTEMF
ncbi:MAG: KpsF/GutQ family sugar-phosphate isomerase [Acidobacteria bacterium]|nr:MAG: KpsF/GutQ family sugar-phosphate isomerase [Acidobacteriota bacterium]